MGNNISAQLLQFCQSILLGLSCALAYDLLRAFRLRVPRLTWALDTLYCLAVGATVFLFTLRRVEGQLRLYVLLGALGGFVLFFGLLSDWLRPLWGFWVDTLAFLLHLLSIPLLWGRTFCAKMWKHGKNLFYFFQKCGTMKAIGYKGLYKGGGKHGKQGKEGKQGKAPSRRSVH